MNVSADKECYSELPKLIGNTMKELRLKRGLSQLELSKIMGVGRSSVAMVEGGTYFAGIVFLIRAAKAFGVSVDYLVGLDKECGGL